MKKTGVFSQIYDKKSDFMKLVYFKIDVLERYFKDPKFLVSYSDYRGSIALDDDHFESDVLDDYEYIKNFGLAYLETNPNKRAVVTFASDLCDMPIKVQAYWYAFLIDNQDAYFPNEGFVKNLILGEWVHNISIYQALLMEQHYINKMCSAIEIPPMFREEYSYSDSQQNERPIHYHNILMPTWENYYNFVNTLEKITTSNLNTKTFLKQSKYALSIERKYTDSAGKEKEKGSVMMLGEWFEKNVADNPNINQDIVLPLKDLVKLRQTPAHKLYKNKYDESIWEAQNELIKTVYISIRNIRMNLSNNPCTKDIEIPNELFDGKHIRIY